MQMNNYILEDRGALATLCWTGVSYEDRQDLLGHKSGRITTHYSAAELDGLITAANSVRQSSARSSLTVLRLQRPGARSRRV